MHKIFYFDTETSGLDKMVEVNGKLQHKYSIVELSYIIELDGEIADKDTLFLAPIPGDAIDEEALKVSGKTKEEVLKYPSAKVGYQKLLTALGKYVDKYNRNDKFYPAGYNVSFDVGFLYDLFIKMGDKYYGSWFTWRLIDPLSIFNYWWGVGKFRELENLKLTTVCEHYGIDLKAHDSMSDIIATRKLIKMLNKVL